MTHASAKTSSTFDTATIFDPTLYLRFYGPSLTAERSEREISQLLEILQPTGPLRILDLPTGFGRHANRLAARGHQVTGVDLTPGFLDRARADAAGLATPPEYVQGDMTSLDAVERFDLIINVYTSFGYHDDATCVDIIRRFAKALVPGGRLVIETMHLGGLLQRWQSTSCYQVEDDLMIDQSTFDPVAGRVQTRRTTIVAGERRVASFFVRLFTPPEFTAMCRDAGLVIERWTDGLAGKLLQRDSYRLLFIARKIHPTEAP
ncbi:methyltransferase type 11 [Planctomycetota bacterium]|nr:methyltransferase type 11 [Planctomycetota bacterium]